jgi:alkanesulfonate monooxygenase SsuD/methylene tetrahydromethanopterin reductase-like flavin-dependent oxidoreductase (luciferase family)
VHPVFAAKALATVDHASGGRAGLNIVCGWSPQEFALFGLTMIEDRYAQGAEWAEIMERIFAGGPPFDYEGQFYQLNGVSGQPTPLQRPRPVTLNAAFSPVGRDFAAKTADFLFTTFVDIEGGRPHIADMTTRARAAGRKVGVFTTCHVVCRPTQAEAEDYHEYYAVRMEDTVSVDFYMGAKEKFSSSHDPEAYRLHRKRFVGGAGTYPLIGTPRKIAEEMVRMSEVGFAGTTISFVNFKNELPYFIEAVLPLLREAGLRQE